MRAGREFGSKPGAGGQASAEWANVDRRERMRQIALERIGLFLFFVFCFFISFVFFCFCFVLWGCLFG